ncbi:MAG: hypothetical protein ACPGQL_06330 [Thermoplasmatota archaeon]
MRGLFGCIVAALLLSGCISTTPVAPSGEPEPWTAPREGSEPWLAVVQECGFCVGPPEVARYWMTLLYEGGEVLWVAYGTNGTAQGVQAPDHPALMPVLEAVFAAVDAPGLGDGRVAHVHDVATGTLGGDDRADARRVLVTSLRHAAPPGEPDFNDCLDCGGTYVIGPDRPTAYLNPFHHEGDAWGTILEQFRLLETWVRP